MHITLLTLSVTIAIATLGNAIAPDTASPPRLLSPTPAQTQVNFDHSNGRTKPIEHVSTPLPRQRRQAQTSSKSVKGNGNTWASLVPWNGPSLPPAVMATLGFTQGGGFRQSPSSPARRPSSSSRARRPSTTGAKSTWNMGQAMGAAGGLFGAFMSRTSSSQDRDEPDSAPTAPPINPPWNNPQVWGAAVSFLNSFASRPTSRQSTPRFTMPMSYTMPRATGGSQPPAWMGQNPSNRERGPLTVKTYEMVPCRPYPDDITSDWSKSQKFNKPTDITVDCWTLPSIITNINAPPGSDIWLHSSTGCWIHEDGIQGNFVDFQDSLPYCPTPQHWVAGLLSQYTRQDCYYTPSLSAPSKNLGSENLVDLVCKTEGESVRDNQTWVKHKDENCYFPGAIFDPSKWYGHSGGLC